MIDAILEERQKTHGKFEEVARLSQMLKTSVRLAQKRTGETLHNEALDNILQKIARITCGNPNHKDSWDDIAGYAMLVSRHLEQTDREGSGAHKDGDTHRQQNGGQA